MSCFVPAVSLTLPLQYVVGPCDTQPSSTRAPSPHKRTPSSPVTHHSYVPVQGVSACPVHSADQLLPLEPGTGAPPFQLKSTVGSTRVVAVPLKSMLL